LFRLSLFWLSLFMFSLSVTNFGKVKGQIRRPLFSCNFTYDLSNFSSELTGGPLGAVGLMPACLRFS
jgi:hypothetical protein